MIRAIKSWRLTLSLLCVVAVCVLGANGAAASDPAIVISPETSDDVPNDILSPIPVYPVLTASQAPKIDGKLDDAIWQKAPRLGRMYLDTGEGPMKFDTIAKLVRDKTHLYLAVDSRHPKIGDVPVKAGKRDKVSWSGETVELFLDTDRRGQGYVQVIFDMSGAFTDSFGGNTNWNGQVSAATDVGGNGWRLEAKLKIADLGGDGKIDGYLWGANVARNTRGQAGSWARLVGSFQQPEAFGLLTCARGGVVVDDLGVGIFALPGLEDTSVPVRFGVTDLAGKSRSLEIRYRLTVQDGESERRLDEAVTATLALPAKQRQLVVRSVEAPLLRTVDVALVEKQTGKLLFNGRLPVRRAPRPDHYFADRQIAASIHPVRPVAISKDEAGLYLLVQSLSASPGRWNGRINIRPVGSDGTIWSREVSIALGPYDHAARRMALPVELLAADDYRVDWQFDKTSTDRAVTTRVLYQPQIRQRLLKLVDAEDVLAALDCPKPKDPRDAAIIQYKVDELRRLLDREADNIEIDLGTPMVRTYRKLRDIVFALRTRGRYAADVRGSYEAAIVSTVDGSRQPFALFVPHDYDENAAKTYRMVVKLHGASGTHGGEAGGADAEYADSFVLVPLGRGKFSSYYAVSGQDVVQEIRTVMANYRIDPDRVHLMGGSMGGFGAFSVACWHPDLFATCTPLCGGGYGPLEQMVNLPTFVHHGLADNVVQPSESIFAVAQMQRGRCPVQLYLHPGMGHGVTQVAMGITTWDIRKDIRRQRDPQTVVLSGGLPALKKAYWLGINRYSDPHAHAYLRATFVGQNHLDLTADNVQWLEVSLPTRWIDPGRPVQISTAKGYRWIEITPGSADAIYVKVDGDKLEATTTPPPVISDETAYIGGGPARMFWEGRAVRIVYGTTGSHAETASLAALAGKLRTWNAMCFGGDFAVGGYPVLEDVKVDRATLDSCDLILLGTPAQNGLVARMAKDLPVKYVENQVVIETTPPMRRAAGSVYLSLFYRNPLSPTRRIWWFAGVTTRTEAEAMEKVLHAGGVVPAPDLIVARKSDSAMVATATIEPDWTLVRPGQATPATTRWATPGQLHRLATDAIRDAFPVDVSLIDAGRLLTNPTLISWADLTVDEALAMVVPRRMMIVQLTGKDLLEFRAAAKAREEDPDHRWSGPSPDAIDGERAYRVLIDNGSASLLLGKWQAAATGRFIPVDEFPDLKRCLATAGP